MRVHFVLPLLVLLTLGRLQAQELRRSALGSLTWRGAEQLQESAPISVSRVAPRDGATLAFAGLFGALGGVTIGGFAGSRLEACRPYDEYCGLAGAVVGASIGSSFTVPLAVHLANQSRGNYGYSVLASAAVAAAGWLLADGTNDATPLLFIPVGQILVSTVIERHTTR